MSPCQLDGPGKRWYDIEHPCDISGGIMFNNSSEDVVEGQWRHACIMFISKLHYIRIPIASIS